MTIYGPLFSNFRHFRRQYHNVCFRWCMVGIAPRSRGVVDYIPDSFLVRHFSSLGVNRIPVSANDVHSDGVYDASEMNPRVWSQGYGQNVGNFSQQSSSTSHRYATNDQISSHPNLGHRTDEFDGFSNGRQHVALQQLNDSHNVNNGVFQQSRSSMHMGNGVAYPSNDRQIRSPPNIGHQTDKVDGHSNQRKNVAFQQINDHQNISGCVLQQSQISMCAGNGVAYPSNGYQQGGVPAVAGGPSANSCGYYNVYEGSYQQSFNALQNPLILAQQQVSATAPWQSTQNDRFDDGVEEALTDFDNSCKDWDLKNAVKYMIDLSEKGVFLDMPRYLNLVDACGRGKALKEAQVVHQHIINFSSPIKVSIQNRILEMYGKCGSMEDAYSLFNNMPERNLTTWDIMITWYAKNGHGEEAIDMFTNFKEAGLKPDGQMFLNIFSACGVIGDVTEGMLHFDSMIKEYGITPTMEHYASIVHMFGSACDIEGALEFIENMPVEPSVDVWESLMNIARVQGNLELGDRCAQIVEQMDPAHLSKTSKDGFLPVDPDGPNKTVKKYNPSEHIKHEYRAGDRSHPESDKIYTVLKGIKELMREAGYVPETKFVLHDIDPESKEEAIMAHSERLAGTTALLTTAARYPIRIIKNLRVCGDCHNYFKILSDLVGREIIMRDAKRFHHFKNGKCSCNDYW